MTILTISASIRSTMGCGAPSHQLAPPLARAVVAGILNSHGAEDTGVPPGQRAADSHLNPPTSRTPRRMLRDAPGSPNSSSPGRQSQPTKPCPPFSAESTPGGDLSGSKLALTIVEHMFWAAFHRGILREADRMAATLTRTALARRSLWGLSRAATAHGHLALRRSRNPRITPTTVAELRAASVRQLTRGAELALRLDRIDAYLGVLRLIVWLSTPTEQGPALAELAAWLPLTPAGIEKATTIYDLAFWACEAGDPDDAARHADDLTDLARQLSNRDVSGMAVVARYAATLTSDPGKAEPGLHQVLTPLAGGTQPAYERTAAASANAHANSPNSRRPGKGPPAGPAPSVSLACTANSAA